ncbi:hypothetical protein [Actinacidiphila sp. bgisy160]|uniref:hypothetical protein n=1 Tax=Actinacidiphila sp. bgisy160 TaxID=3413796 RepID=UPI003D708777
MRSGGRSRNGGPAAAFAGAWPAGRRLDTLVGAAADLPAFAVPNRRAGHRAGAALRRLAEDLAAFVTREAGSRRPCWSCARAAGTASGEWRTRALPQRRIAAAEERGRLLPAGRRGDDWSVTVP